MELIDCRSDTVTKPTAAMREAMAQAEVGDDVYGEDPTVNTLQERVARLFGHEAALFCASGTMANQLAIRAHTKPGDEVICESGAHVYWYEGGGIMANSQCSVRLLSGDHGRFTADQLRTTINDPSDPHRPVSRLVCIENTCNRGGGAIWDKDEIARIQEVCTDNGLKLHLDGARLFNALAETGESPTDHGRLFDSVSICLSKGLGAPVGSVLTGGKGFIAEARRIRKRMGGGMRQAGILAAAGLFALDHHVGRLMDDHRRAKVIGNALERSPLFEEVLPVQTNIVIARLAQAGNAGRFVTRLRENRILVNQVGEKQVRFVTHLDVNDRMMDRLVDVLEKLT